MNSKYSFNQKSDKSLWGRFMLSNCQLSKAEIPSLLDHPRYKRTYMDQLCQTCCEYSSIQRSIYSDFHLPHFKKLHVLLISAKSNCRGIPLAWSHTHYFCKYSKGSHLILIIGLGKETCSSLNKCLKPGCHVCEESGLRIN